MSNDKSKFDGMTIDELKVTAGIYGVTGDTKEALAAGLEALDINKPSTAPEKTKVTAKPVIKEDEKDNTELLELLNDFKVNGISNEPGKGLDKVLRYQDIIGNMTKTELSDFESGIDSNVRKMFLFANPRCLDGDTFTNILKETTCRRYIETELNKEAKKEAERFNKIHAQHEKDVAGLTKIIEDLQTKHDIEFGKVIEKEMKIEELESRIENNTTSPCKDCKYDIRTISARKKELENNLAGYQDEIEKDKTELFTIKDLLK